MNLTSGNRDPMYAYLPLSILLRDSDKPNLQDNKSIYNILLLRSYIFIKPKLAHWYPRLNKKVPLLLHSGVRPSCRIQASPAGILESSRHSPLTATGWLWSYFMLARLLPFWSEVLLVTKRFGVILRQHDMAWKFNGQKKYQIQGLRGIMDYKSLCDELPRGHGDPPSAQQPCHFCLIRTSQPLIYDFKMCIRSAQKWAGDIYFQMCVEFCLS